MISEPVETVMREAGEHLRRHDLAAARSRLEAGIAAHPTSPPLRGFAGLLALQAGDPEAAARHLAEAVMLAPDDRASRTNLVHALTILDRLDEAEVVAAPGDRNDPRLARMMGFIHQQRGRHAEAANAYQVVTAAFPGDWESWNNLGNALAAAGRIDAFMDAFRRATAINRSDPRLRINASRALVTAGRSRQRQQWLREAVRDIPTNADLYVELGLAEGEMHDHERSEQALRAALTRDPRHVDALLELGMLMEHLNRLDELGALVAHAERYGVAQEVVDFLRAWQLRREGKWAEALALLGERPASIAPPRFYQSVADLADRTGDADRAFAAYQAMNDAVAALTLPSVRAGSQTFLAQVRATAAETTPASVAGWQNVTSPADPPAPVFIAGFPRSGTTLLDTLLMGLPDTFVLEEMPVMQAVEQALGGRAIGALEGDAVAELRHRYFETAYEIASPPDGAILIDKFPLHMARMPLIHRLFPDAKVVFAERHPCDVLFSCFASNFQPNQAMVHFHTLEGAAALYDAAFSAWKAANEALPIDVHAVRYERVVEDLEAEMRALVAFLGLPWDERMLDHQATAARRDRIKTASYAQVTEPIYRRSSGRWHRYRDHLAPVLPVLAPWVERMGYSLD